SATDGSNQSCRRPREATGIPQEPMPRQLASESSRPLPSSASAPSVQPFGARMEGSSRVWGARGERAGSMARVGLEPAGRWTFSPLRVDYETFVAAADLRGRGSQASLGAHHLSPRGKRVNITRGPTGETGFPP